MSGDRDTLIVDIPGSHAQVLQKFVAFVLSRTPSPILFLALRPQRNVPRFKLVWKRRRSLRSVRNGPRRKSRSREYGACSLTEIPHCCRLGKRKRSRNRRSQCERRTWDDQTVGSLGWNVLTLPSGVCGDQGGKEETQSRGEGEGSS